MTIKELAVKHMTAVRSPLFENREKIATKDIIGEELHLIACDIIDDPKKPYAVCVFAEHPNNFVFAGTVLTNLIVGLLEQFEDITALSEALSNEPLKMKMFVDTAKKPNNETGFPNNYTNIELLD